MNIRLLEKWDLRTIKAFQNIIASVLIKGGSVLITFLLVPLTLGYLNTYEYGVWLTLSSVLAWINLLDIGLGNGLRNKLAEAIAASNYKLGREYVSTTFFVMSIIVIAFYVVFYVVQNFIDWNNMLNVSATLVPQLNSIVKIVVACVCITFVFKLIGSIYCAYQLPAVNDLFGFCGNAFSLLLIYILTKTTGGSLSAVSLVFSLAPGLVYVLVLPYTFIKFKNIKPTLQSIRFSLFRELIDLGGQFFIIQIAVMLLYMSSNIIISKIFGPQEVTPYNIAFRYFSILTVVFNIILSPIWTAVTDAKSKGDVEWIKRTLQRLLFIWGVMLIVIIMMIFFAGTFYSLWLQDQVIIPTSLNIWSGVYIAITSLCSIYANIINGYGKLRIQLISAVFQCIVYIPIAAICGRIYGITGILIALCIVTSLALLWSPYQSYKLIIGQAKGIFNK